jgi:uncharacterized repeat protein (TIGR01451 family)
MIGYALRFARQLLLLAIVVATPLAAQAAVSVTSAATLCAATTSEVTATNLITNSDFLNTTTSTIGVGGGVSTATFNTQPVNNNSGYQSGTAIYAGLTVNQAAFPGDAARSVAASTNWLLANGNRLAASAGIWWSQTISGMFIGHTYTFVVYASSPVNGAQNSIPNLNLVVTQAAGQTLALGLVVADTAAADVWKIYDATFLATQGTATLAIVNSVTSNPAEPRGLFAIAQPTLRNCSPLVNVSITKTNNATTVTAGGTTSYVVTVVNSGPNAADNSTLKDVPDTDLSCTTVTCGATAGGAVCPTAGAGAGQLSIGNLLGSGIALATLPSSSTISFTVNCSVLATGQ